MYHYISKCSGSIAVHPDIFEEHCRLLAQKGWRGIALDEAEAYLLHGAPLPRKSVLFTFDDGYLDNYVYAWPILKKYGHKGVIFAVTSKIAQRPECYPTIEDVTNGLVPHTALPPVDTPFQQTTGQLVERQDMFFSWHEARAMEASGIISVAAHSTAHKLVFNASHYAAFSFPRSRGRTFYAVEGDMPWGMPAFPQGAAFSHRAFVPSAHLLDTVRALVPQDKAEAWAFAQSTQNMDILRRAVAALSEDELGAFETDTQRIARMEQEIASCKATLEKELGHQVQSFCWPWGATCPEALALARQYGFTVLFETTRGANPPMRSDAVHRFKAKNKSASWLLSRVRVYSRPLAASLYALIHR